MKFVQQQQSVLQSTFCCSIVILLVQLSCISISNAWVPNQQKQQGRLIVSPVSSMSFASNTISTTLLSQSTTTIDSVTSIQSEEQGNNNNNNEMMIRGKDYNNNYKWHNHCTDRSIDRDILIRAARGERTERTPVWFMRQAGRYMKAFRDYSDYIPFRERSETSSIAIELSLQCHRAYGMDGIIMFSDILTPLPILGIEFDVIKGTGPVISTKITSEHDIDIMPNEYNFDDKLPFIKDILQTLSIKADEANTTLIGFIGAPFTLAAYTLEQKGSKHCLVTKNAMSLDECNESKMITKLITKLAHMIGHYACYQIDNGAQIIQMFESWAHQLSPYQFELYAKPAALKAIKIIKAKHPTVPIIYYANGGSSYLEQQKDMVASIATTGSNTINTDKADMIGIDWHINIATARQILGPNVPISGNMDPSILRVGTKEQIEQAARSIIDDAGGPGNYHIFNLGHGVMQGTPEIAIQWLVDEIKRYSSTTSTTSPSTSN